MKIIIANITPLGNHVPAAEITVAAPVYTAGIVEVAVALGLPGMRIPVAFAVGVAFPAPIGGRAGLPVIALPPAPVVLFVADTDRLSTSTSVSSGLRTLLTSR